MRLDAAMTERLATRRRGIPVMMVIVASLSGLAILAVTLVSFAGFKIAQRNTFELTRDKAGLALNAIEARIRAHLDPVHALLGQLAEHLAEGRIGGLDSPGLEPALLSAVGATPQVSVIGLVDPAMSALVVLPHRPGRPAQRRSIEGDPSLERAMAQARAERAPFWGELYFAESAELAFLNLYAPIHRGAEFQGVLVAGISVRELSEFLSAQGEGKDEDDIFLHAFVLYDRDQVLAHPLLTGEPFPGRSDHSPLPRIVGFGDPVLHHIWNPERRFDVDSRYLGRFQAHATRVADEDYLFIYRELPGYGQAAWTIGTYLEAADIATQALRLGWIPLISAAILVAALALAIVLGRSLSRTPRRLAEAANRVRGFELDAIAPLGGSPIREVNDAAAAFNAMIAGLRSFETYVPRGLVRELIERHGAAGVPSEDRELTVLFSDITGFTAMAESLRASEIATFLNEHFTLLGRCVQAEGGTIDKYIGDGLMAFWGAPLPLEDTASPACRATLAIGAAIEADNRRRRAAGLPPVRLRMGVHTGPVVVGNIGLPGRINYTVVGDTVNVCQRLEGLGKEIDREGQGELSILVSGATAARLDGRFDLEPVGRWPVKGRGQEIEVYRLRPAAAHAASPKAPA